MTTNTSSIAAASSNIQERVEEAIQKASANLGKERIQRIKQVKLRADDLSNRGFLRRQTYSSLSSADFARLYPSSCAYPTIGLASQGSSGRSLTEAWVK